MVKGCSNENCSIKHTCHRAKKIFDEYVYNKEKDCKMFIKNNNPRKKLLYDNRN